MAKIKENLRNKAKAATTTTPKNKINGKVHKVRVNVKNKKNVIKTTDEASKTNSIDIDNQLSQKTSLCFVKLRRTHINDTSNNNNNNVYDSTLLAQCKGKEQIVREVSENIKKTTRGRNNGIKNNVSGNVSQETNNKNLNQKKSTITRKKSKSDAESNDLLPKTPTKTKRCVIQIQKTPRCLNAKDIVALTSSSSCNNKPKENDTCFTRKCRVRIRKIPDKSKIKAVGEPVTPSAKKNFVIRLQRTPLTHEKNMKRDNPELVSSPLSSQTALIDQNKRDNFRKLSLTKSLRKSTESNKTYNSKTEQQLIEDLNSNHNMELEKQTNETLNMNNNEPKPTNNLVNQLKYQNGIKYRNKLSLSKTRPILKNVVNNLELTQFEPQQNSTILFEPTRNSTLLEFGFTKDTNKENLDPKEVRSNNDNEEKTLSKSKSTSKDDKSLTRDESLSQNLANKSDEIVNILNSLDDCDVITPERNNNEHEKEISVENKSFDCSKEKQQNPLPKDSKTSQIKSPAKSNKNDSIQLKSPERNNSNNGQEKHKNIENNISPNNKTHKFFNRSKENEPNILPKDSKNPQFKSPPKSKDVAKKRRFLTKRTTLTKPDNIYEFLSQSQTSDSDNNTKQTDPTADIIKKLIEQGKVRVATNCKGKGKPIFKRRVPPPKQMKKLKQAADKKLKQIKKNQLKTKTANTNENKTNDNHNNADDDEVIVEHFEDHFDNEDLLPDVDYNMENQKNISLINGPSHSNAKNDATKGTMSRLARSVLINQASRSDAQRKNASLLLNKVKQLISTPKNKKMPSPQIGLGSDLSPIAMPTTRPATIPSPWRVNDDAFLPKTFNFSRSSGNLPSFSSDFIPATPKKQKPKNGVNIPEQQTTNQNSISSIPEIQSPLHCNKEKNSSPSKEVQNANGLSVISSFSSNDSNAENMPPPRHSGNNSNENENIFNMKQLPNPRRALSHRSPLKNINILEVVHLPPIKNFNKTPQTNKQNMEAEIDMFGFEENLTEDSMQVEQSIVAQNVPESTDINKNTTNRPEEDLFGFEDFLSQTEHLSQDNVETTNQDNRNVNNVTIHEKLQELRKLKPAENELQVNLLKEKSSRALKPLPLFDDEAAANFDGMRQKGIKEMLCSTLIDPKPSTSKEALRELRKRNSKNLNRPQFCKDLEISELFRDPDPETTFNESDAHRTYIRPYKRKRRLKENKFVMFLDSDASDDDDISGERRKHHETDTSSEQQEAPKKKRQRRAPKEKPELKEFVEEFNEMCKEVESFELIVEKSA